MLNAGPIEIAIELTFLCLFAIVVYRSRMRAILYGLTGLGIWIACGFVLAIWNPEAASGIGATLGILSTMALWLGSCFAPKLPKKTEIAPSGKLQAFRISKVVAVALLAFAVAVGGGFWFASVSHDEQERDSASAGRKRAAITFCDSVARSKLDVPNTMELVGDPKADEPSPFMISVEREIAAKDKDGTRYHYRYVCSAPADGKGGIGQVSLELLPTND